MSIKKMIATVSLGAFALFLLAPMSASAAENDVKIKNNNAWSWNSAWVFDKKENKTIQNNTTVAETNIGVHSNTGHNKSWSNTGKNSSNTINTGGTSTSVSVDVEGGTNRNTDDCECEESSTSATISGNGHSSQNSIVVVNKNEKTTNQSNTTVAETNVGAASNTGGNSTVGNTGGSTSITTSHAVTTADVSVGGSTNISN